MPASKQKAPFNNLPTPLSSFIGREREIPEVRKLLLANRLVTLTGPGGCGKTRLALKVADLLLEEFEHGICFVELASVFNPALVPQTVGSAFNIRESSRKSLMDILVNYLSPRQILLVLDNCEHLVSSCAEFAEAILQKCPHLKILTTSRQVLGITGEVTWSVPSLSLPSQQPWTNPASVPSAVQYYEEFESVQLFVVRAKANDPGFALTTETGPWVAEICRHLDGMPLAIELAAARVRSLTLQQIAQKLDDRFHLLTGGSRTAPPRQQTLAATLDWSHTMLSEEEQKVLHRLAVFAGGATLDATEWVCLGEGVESAVILDILSRLVDKSLIIADKPESGEARYRLLETIRQYAFEKLAESGQVSNYKDRHLKYFLQWTENAEPHLGDADQLKWFKLFEAEHDNLRAALDWCNADDSRAAMGLRLAVSCCRFWRLRGYLSEGRSRISTAISRSDAGSRNETHALALFWGASLAYLQSDYPETRLLAEESLNLWRELNSTNRVRLANTLDVLGELATEEGDYATAPKLFEEALEIFRELEDPRGVGDMLMQLGWAYMRMGRYEAVAPLMEEALAIFREIGYPSLLGFTLSGLGELAIRQGQYERAKELLEESLEIRNQHGHKWGIGTSLGSLAWVALLQHDLVQMKTWFQESLAIRTEIGDRGGIAWCLEKLGEAKYQQSEFHEAAKIFGHAESVRAPIGSVIDPADQSGYKKIIFELRSALGEEKFTMLWEEGAALPLEEIINYALSAPEISSESTRGEKVKFGGLTQREREVAGLIAQGKSNREIAETMTVSVKTIETYVTRILNKLGFDSRVQIATWAVEKGLK